MFSRKISRTQKEYDLHPQRLQKRSTLMCLPDNTANLKQSITPPPRTKLSKNNKSLSLESLFPVHLADQNRDEYIREQTKRWSESFMQLLSDRKGVETFLAFLEVEHSSENLRFWIECQKYKTMTIESLGDKAQDIYDKYLCETSECQVNIDSATLKDIQLHLCKPNVWTFDKIEHDVLLLMKRDSYPRFLKSEKYLDLLQGPSHEI